MGILDKKLSLRDRNKMLIGVWEDEDQLVATASELVHAGVHIHDIYTPYPVHGLDRIIGARRSKLARIAFFCAITGFTLMTTMIWYMYVHDWPMNIVLYCVQHLVCRSSSFGETVWFTASRMKH
jgi:hypothetical protein